MVESRLAATLEALGEAVTIQSADGRSIYANQAALDLLKLSSLEELVATAPGEISARFEIQSEDGTPINVSEFPGNRALRGEEYPSLLVRNVVRATGEERWLLNKATVLKDSENRIEMVINLIENVTAPKQAERRAKFLAQAGKTLASSLDYKQTLENVASLAVPEVADWCAVDLVDADGDRESVTVAHVDPTKLALAGELRRYDTRELDPSEGLGAVVHTGETQVYQAIPDLSLAEVALDEEHLRLLRAVGLHSVVMAPLRTAHGTIGVLTLVNAESRRSFAPEDIELAEELARRAAAAVENARLFSERTHIARTLQENLLPEALPEIPGWQLGALYRPSGGSTEIGGDFYDVVPTAAGWVLVIGDVTGKGVTAAGLTSLVRHSIRAIAHYESEPSTIIERLDEILRDQRGMQTCTVACIRLEDEAVTGAAGGHPLPLIVGPDGVNAAGEPGSLIGAFENGKWPVWRASVPRGSSLVLFTDGVTDSQAPDGERFGDQRLAELLAAAPSLDPPELVRHIDAGLTAFESAIQADDIGVLIAKSLAPTHGNGQTSTSQRQGSLSKT
jgi:serine phosphatase RsbU (regulator of sigma subunit)